MLIGVSAVSPPCPNRRRSAMPFSGPAKTSVLVSDGCAPVSDRAPSPTEGLPVYFPPTPYHRVPSRVWRELIKKVWNIDPLLCPKCGGQMRLIALIEDDQVIEEILRHLGLWEQL